MAWPKLRDHHGQVAADCPRREFIDRDISDFEIKYIGGDVA